MHALASPPVLKHIGGAFAFWSRLNAGAVQHAECSCGRRRHKTDDLVQHVSGLPLRLLGVTIEPVTGNDLGHRSFSAEYLDPSALGCPAAD
jgi:hypothetical protein